MTYNDLLDAGWRMSDIDEMDMLGFLRLRAWRVNRKKKKQEPKRRCIDEIWPMSK